MFTGYIPTPKSQRDLFAKERAEEERLEHEITRAAAEAQLERNQRHIEQGRQDMRKYQKTASNKAEDGEGSDGSDAEDGIGGAAGSRVSARKRKVNRSVFGDTNTTAEIRMQILQERISSVACGVSRKTSARFGELAIPAAPMRMGGVVKLITTQDKKRALRKPIIAESKGLKEALDRPLVSLSLALEAPTPAAPTAPATTPGKSKKSKENNVAFVAPPPASESTLLSWSHDRLQTAILEQSAAVTMAFQHRVESLQAARLESSELVQAHTVQSELSFEPSDEVESDLEDDLSLSQLQISPSGQARVVQATSTGNGRDPYLHGISHYMKKKPRSNQSPVM